MAEGRSGALVQDFAGETVIVTGAAQGLGQAIADAAAARGAHLVLCDLDEDKVRDVAAQLTATHNVQLARRCDVTDAAAVGRLVEDAMAEFGRINHLVNNAGTLHIGAVTETPRRRSAGLSTSTSQASSSACAPSYP